MFGGSSQLPTMLSELCSMILFDLITMHSAVVGSWEELLNILINGSEKRICRLSFELLSPNVIEACSKCVSQELQIIL